MLQANITLFFDWCCSETHFILPLSNGWLHTLRGNTLMIFKSSPPVYWSAWYSRLLACSGLPLPQLCLGVWAAVTVGYLLFPCSISRCLNCTLKRWLALLPSEEFNLHSSWWIVFVSEGLCCSPGLCLDLSASQSSPLLQAHPPFAFTTTF